MPQGCVVEFLRVHRRGAGLEGTHCSHVVCPVRDDKKLSTTGHIGKPCKGLGGGYRAKLRQRQALRAGLVNRKLLARRVAVAAIRPMGKVMGKAHLLCCKQQKRQHDMKDRYANFHGWQEKIVRIKTNSVWFGN